MENSISSLLNIRRNISNVHHLNRIIRLNIFLIVVVSVSFTFVETLALNRTKKKAASLFATRKNVGHEFLPLKSQKKIRTHLVIAFTKHHINYSLSYFAHSSAIEVRTDESQIVRWAQHDILYTHLFTSLAPMTKNNLEKSCSDLLRQTALSVTWYAILKFIALILIGDKEISLKIANK